MTYRESLKTAYQNQHEITNYLPLPLETYLFISKKDQSLFNFSLKPFFLRLKSSTLFKLSVAHKLV